MKKILFCFGTRPEAIKMAPVIHEAKNAGFETFICLSGQHREMLSPFLDFFNLKADYNLNVMKPDQTLGEMTSSILIGVTKVLNSNPVDMVIVQGDTTTTFASALAAFYQKIPVAHVEAGLRTLDKYSPFPEEINRKMVSSFATLNFPPTEASKRNLEKEGIFSNVFVTGNTSIDALKLAVSIIRDKNIDKFFLQKYSSIDFSKRLLLVTVHRRENHGLPLENICNALLDLCKENSDIEIVLPLHLNPNVKSIVEKMLGGNSKIHLLAPLDYPDFVCFMQNTYMILTDSGGVQEEGPYFQKPILVLRESTERPEGIEAGTSILVGTSRDKIYSEVQKLLENREYYNKFSKIINPYGKGIAARNIIECIKNI